MKVIRVFLCISLLMIVASCSSITVKSDYDREVNFVKYKTYKWMPASTKHGRGDIAPNSLLDKRIRRAVERELKAKGFRQITVGKSDFLLNYQTAVREKVDVTAVNYGYWRRGPRARTVYVDRYKQGTLVVDIVDPELKQLIWRGWAVGVVGSPEESEDRINESVKKILEKFPPQ